MVCEQKTAVEEFFDLRLTLSPLHSFLKKTHYEKRFGEQLINMFTPHDFQAHFKSTNDFMLNIIRSCDKLNHAFWREKK